MIIIIIGLQISMIGIQTVSIFKRKSYKKEYARSGHQNSKWSQIYSQKIDLIHRDNPKVEQEVRGSGFTQGKVVIEFTT